MALHRRSLLSIELIYSKVFPLLDLQTIRHFFAQAAASTSCNAQCGFIISLTPSYCSFTAFTLVSNVLSRISLVNSQSVEIVDGSDHTRVNFTGFWFDAPRPNQIKGFAILACSAGETASFTFTGIGLSIFGTIAPPKPNATTTSYTVDGGDPLTYATPDVTETEYRVAFYQSPQLMMARIQS
ncbi:hypothetical protein M422DRAFT_32481 [Sphaerobolus stellatus SS14]|uniref:Uncharacterized protein n=1 Tax=Sphaerobolus stellatus (strain SS14) TaxID=990650 RepID=A0A0C9VP52_SPHS4|nr:hypothetical protein M422DRAFT_32481 [Sphaerobolus stellatus SS14]